MKSRSFAVLLICAGCVSAQPGAEAPPESVASFVQHMKDGESCEAAAAKNNVSELIEWSRNPHPNLRGDAIRSAPLLKPAERITFALGLTDDPAFRLPNPGRGASYIIDDENIRPLLGLIFGEEFSAGSFYDEAFRTKIRARLIALGPNVETKDSSVVSRKPTADGATKEARAARAVGSSSPQPPPVESVSSGRLVWLICAAIVVAALTGYFVTRRRP